MLVPDNFNLHFQEQLVEFEEKLVVARAEAAAVKREERKRRRKAEAMAAKEEEEARLGELERLFFFLKAERERDLTLLVSPKLDTRQLLQGQANSLRPDILSKQNYLCMCYYS